jgi:hypothetical protein
LTGRSVLATAGPRFRPCNGLRFTMTHRLYRKTYLYVVKCFLALFFRSAIGCVVAENPVLPVRLPQDIIDRLDAVAERIGSNRSSVIRVCIQSFVEEFERTGKATLPPNWRTLLLEFDNRTVESRTRYPSLARNVALNQRPSAEKARAKSLAARVGAKAAGTLGRTAEK